MFNAVVLLLQLAHPLLALCENRTRELMPSEQLPKRFFAGTRGRILTLLRREARTVDDLAQALELSGNAVRVHLTALERDGLVQQEQSGRRGVGKPAYIYKLTSRAENLFPKTYDRVLDHMLNLLAERMTSDEIEELLRAIGKRMAALERPKDLRSARERHGGVPNGDLRARLNMAVDILNQLGGLTEIEEQEDRFSICGYSCPLGPLVVEHPNLCEITQYMLIDLIGMPVYERCERNEALWCRFEVPRQEAGS
jgi:predicted ArsR family transcriptional regulator